MLPQLARRPANSPRSGPSGGRLALPSAPAAPTPHFIPDQEIGIQQPQQEQEQEQEQSGRLPEFRFGASSARPGGALPEAVGGAEGVAGAAEELLGAL